MENKTKRNKNTLTIFNVIPFGNTWMHLFLHILVRTGISLFFSFLVGSVSVLNLHYSNLSLEKTTGALEQGTGERDGLEGAGRSVWLVCRMVSEWPGLRLERLVEIQACRAQKPGWGVCSGLWGYWRNRKLLSGIGVNKKTWKDDSVCLQW